MLHVVKPKFTADQILANVVCDPGYSDWQINRMMYMLDTFGHDFFKGKRVLEIGSYLGDFTQMLANVGAIVKGVEGSDRNLEAARRHYPDIDFVKWDAETPLPDEKYDVIIHFGVLYHLENPAQSIRDCLLHTDVLLLETLVWDKIDTLVKYVKEDNVGLPDQALRGIGCRPTVSYIENIVLDGIVGAKKYARHDSAALNSRYQPHYDAPVGDTGETFRRFWVIKK